MLPGCSLNSANTKFSKSVTNQYIGVNDMFLGVRQDIWIIMLLCVLIVFLYSVIGDLAAAKKNSERASRFQPMKYAAIALCAVIAVVATVISKHEVYIGSPMLALIIGIVIVNLIPDEKFSKSFQAGTSYAGKKYLNLGIIALGATLAFTDIFSAVYALPLVLFNMILAFSMANLVGRKVLKVSPNTCTLVGGGTCICGGTAITDNAYKLASPFFGMIMPATILGLYWPRASREGAWAGTVSGLIVVVIFTFFATPPLGVSAFLWGLIVNFIVMIVVSLCTKVPEEIVDKYIRNVNNIITTGNSCYDVVDGAVAKMVY